MTVWRTPVSVPPRLAQGLPQQPKPRERLQALLGTPQGQEQVRGLAETLGGGEVATVRAALVLAGMPVPSGDMPVTLIWGLLQAGWRVFPVCLSPPQPSDVFVVTDSDGQPRELGWVAKAVKEPGKQVPIKSFVALTAAQERPYRRQVVDPEHGVVAFWVRPAG